MYRIIITPVATDEKSIHTFDDILSAGDFLVSYLNDEFNEQGGRISKQELYRAIGRACMGCAAGADFTLVFDGELFIVEDLNAPPKPQSLYTLLGHELNIAVLSSHLIGEVFDKPLFSHMSASMYLFPLWQAKFANHDDDGEQLSYDAEAFAEIFSSNAWRNKVRGYSRMQLLGEYDTEESGPEIPDEWRKGWHQLTMSNSWSLRALHTEKGVLMSLDFSDEGFVHEYWFYLTK